MKTFALALLLAVAPAAAVQVAHFSFTGTVIDLYQPTHSWSGLVDETVNDDGTAIVHAYSTITHDVDNFETFYHYGMVSARAADAYTVFSISAMDVQYVTPAMHAYATMQPLVISPVPETASWAMVALGLFAGIGRYARRFWRWVMPRPDVSDAEWEARQW